MGDSENPRERLIDKVVAIRNIINNEEFTGAAFRPEHEPQPSEVLIQSSCDTRDQMSREEPPSTTQDQALENEADVNIEHDLAKANTIMVSTDKTSDVQVKTQGVRDKRKLSQVEVDRRSTEATDHEKGSSSDPDLVESNNDSNEDRVVENEPALENEEECGSRIELRKLYTKDDPDSDEKITWTSRLPVSLKLDDHFENANKTRDATKTFAIVHFYQIVGHFLRSVSICVQNPVLKRKLGLVLDGYPGVDTSAPELVFKPPYIAFLHRWDRLLEAEETDSNPESKKLLEVLRETLDFEMTERFRAAREYEKTRFINYFNILIPFVPGDVILRSTDRGMVAGILEKASIVKTYWSNYCEISVKVIDWNGEMFGYVSRDWKISAFDGFIKATELECFPLNIHPERHSVQEYLLRRGREFERLRGRHISHYDGTVLRQKRWEGGSTVTLNERIIIDTVAYYRFQQESVPSMVPLDDLTEKQFAAPHNERSDTDGYDECQGQRCLSDDQAILAVPQVKGFAIESKEWCEFDVTKVSEVTWNESMIKNLVLQEDEKELLLALVSRNNNEERKEDKFDDFVQGKGKGLILLLAGPPGVGKTLTSESVAEKLQRPLYRVRAGDLGSSATKAEKALKEALDLCSYWDAVLLIDEADVFLEKRSSENLKQNELVSVFLVMLEYYQGVLILTTNRNESIDSAFESRIDIALSFEPLSQDARRQIWANFTRQMPRESIDINENDLDRLAEWTMNGRQIKSAMKTARMLAREQKVELSLRQLQTVLHVRRRGSRLMYRNTDQPGSPGSVLGRGRFLTDLIRMCIIVLDCICAFLRGLVSE